MTTPFTAKADGAIIYAAHMNAVQNGLEQIHFNVCAPNYGADRTGSTFSTTAIQLCIDDAKAVNYGPGNNTRGAIVHFPPGYYKVDDTLDLDGARGVTLRGGNYRAGTTSFANSMIKFTSTSLPLFDLGSTNNDTIGIEYMSLIGSQASVTAANNANICIYGASANSVHLRGLNIYAFGGPAVKLDAGFSFRMFESNIVGCYFDYDSLAAPGGIIWINGGEPYIQDVNCNGPFTNTAAGQYNSGYLAAYYLTGAPVWLANNNAAFAAIGYHIGGGAWNAPSIISDCRSEFNQGEGWLIEGGDVQMSNCWAFDCGLDADATYSGFRIDRDVAASGYPIRNKLSNCTAANLTSPGGNTNKLMYGFTDDAAGVADIAAYGTKYVNCDGSGFATGGRIFNFTGTIQPTVSRISRFQSGSLNTTPSPDELTFDGESGVVWRAIIASGAATKIKFTNIIAGQIYTLYIVQHATPGTVTLDAGFAKVLGFTSPAASKQLTCQFYSNGTTLIQVGSWSGDM